MNTILQRIKNFLAFFLSIILFFAGCRTSCFGDILTQQEREWLARHKGKITLAVETNYAPFAFVDKDGKSSGLATDYIQLIQKKLDVNLKEVPFQSFNNIIESAKKNEVDIVNAVTETANRSRYLLFTKPFIEIPNVIIVEKDRFETLTIDNLKKLKVSAVKNYAITEYLSKNYASLDMDLVPDELTALLSVSFNRTDCAVLDLATASYLIDQKGITNLQVAGDAGYDIKLSIASRKDWPVLNKILNKGLEAVNAHERESIRKKWISVGESHFTKTFWGIIIAVTSIFLFCLLAVLIWNRTLRKQVVKRTNQLTAELEEREKTEKALQKSEAKYSTILKTAMDGFLLTNTEGRLIEVNDAYCRMSGYSEAELLNMGIPELDVVQTPELMAKHIQKAAAFGSERFESKHRGKDGTIFDVEVSTQFSAEEGGRYVCFLRDVTERRVAMDALHTSEEQYREYFEENPAGSYISTPDGRLVACNKEYLNIFGFKSKKDALRTGISRVYVNPDERIELINTLSERHPVINKESVFKKIDGTSVTVVENASGLFDEDGNLTHIRGFLLNISEQRRLEAQILQAQKMETIGTLAGGIAHDFNNILFPVVGYAQMLLEDIGPDSPLRAGLEEIYTSALRAKELVKQILTFSRQEKGEVRLFKIQPVIKEVLGLIRSTIPATIGIVQDIQKDCGPIKADPTQIHQIIMNLTTNAYHAMENNGGEMRVELREVALGHHDLFNPDMKPGPYACLSIKDTGVGIEEEIKNQIFDPFFTTKEKGKGTGMGLSVVHGIVKSLNGGIQVFSEKDKGTAFHIYFPIYKIIKSDHGHAQAPPIIMGGNERILFVDDEASIIAVQRQLLKRLGYQVTPFTNSTQAYEAFRETPEKFDLVITDLAMPGMPGDRLAEKILRLKPDMKIILCTGFSDKVTQDHAAAMGISGMLEKPIVKSELAGKIREVLKS